MESSADTWPVHSLKQELPQSMVSCNKPGADTVSTESVKWEDPQVTVNSNDTGVDGTVSRESVKWEDPLVMVESDVDYNMMCLKVEPKDEITIEDHCISLEEGSGGVISCSSEDYMANSRKCVTDLLPSQSGVYARRRPPSKEKDCTVCGKSFTCNYHLRQHLKIHSGEKDHKCAECGTWFTQNSSLRQHLKIHSGKKDHICTICGKCFYLRGHLRNHLKIHSGKKDYKCVRCGKCFTQSSGLRRHFKSLCCVGSQMASV